MDSNISIQSQLHQKEKSVREKQKETSKNQKNGSSADPMSDDSDVENDLTSTIKHNTITSLAALKDMLNAYGEPTAANGNFFQHYFQNHTNSLPSRSVINCRRLSQCREEDEEEEKKEHVPSSDMATISGSDKSLSESSSGSKTSVIDTVSGPTHKFVVTKTKQPSEAAKLFAKKKEYKQANTVHFPTSDSRTRPSVYSIFSKASSLSSPHYDSRYFDSSLIEMRSPTSSSSTLDCGSNEDIWVRRTTDSKKVGMCTINLIRIKILLNNSK